MIKITYSEHGNAYSDHGVEDACRVFIQMHNPDLEDDMYVFTSTENMITAMRMLIAEGEISHEQVMFRLSNTSEWQYTNIDGELLSWDGMGDFQMKHLRRMFQARKARRQSNENR